MIVIRLRIDRPQGQGASHIEVGSIDTSAVRQDMRQRTFGLVGYAEESSRHHMARHAKAIFKLRIVSSGVTRRSQDAPPTLSKDSKIKFSRQRATSYGIG